jgi:hypothetical protein
VQVELIFLFGEAHHQAIEPTVEIPINVSKVIPGAVGTMVSKVHSAPESGALL